MDVYVSKGNQIKDLKRRRLRLFLMVAIIGALLVLGWYTIFVSQVFKVKLEFSGLSRLSEEQIKRSLVAAVFDSTLAGLLGQDNYLAWPSKIKLKEPLIAELIVEKNLLEKKIVFHFKEREPFGIWCVSVFPALNIEHLTASDANCSWFSKDGVLFAPAPITEGSLILRVDSDGGEAAVLGNRVISDDFYRRVKEIFDFFSESKKPVRRYAIDNQLQEFRARLADGPDVRFSLRFDPTGSLEALTNLLEKPKYQRASYIDLTVENRVYAK